MSYPAAIATGNVVIAAALEWADADTAFQEFDFDTPDTGPIVERWLDATTDLLAATAGHRVATALVQQTPVRDADHPTTESVS